MQQTSEMGDIHTKFPFKTLIQDYCTCSAIKLKQNANFDNFKTLDFSLITAQ